MTTTSTRPQPRAAPRRRVRLSWSDPMLRGIFWQILIVGVIVGIVWYLVDNTNRNLTARRIATGFGFLDRVAGIPIGESLIAYDPSIHTYGRALLVGILNTLRVSVIGIVLATIIGTFIGIGRLSKNWLLARFTAVYVEVMRDIPLLRYAVTALGVLVLARVVWDPRIMGSDVGSTPIFNWLLIGYGVPAAAFLTSARLLSARKQDNALAFADGLGVLFVGLLAFFEIRHLTNGGNVLHSGFGHVEAGLMTLVALGLSLSLARLNYNRTNVIFDAASLVFGAGSVLLAVFGLALGANPLFSGEWVGGRVLFSSLLPAYLVPGAAALYMARAGRGIQSDRYLRIVGAMAVGLITLFVTLEVRHAFQGPEISIDLPTSDSEQWAHSFAWLVLGVAFLSYGLLRGSLEARIASAVLIVLAALKITVFDLAGIGGLWRALSFLCLGAVLIGIGLVYQKIVFAPPANAQR